MTWVSSKGITPPGWKEAYAQFTAAGWSALPCPEEFGGQGLPSVLSMAACEIWNASNLSFGLCPLLTQGAIDAIVMHGSDALKSVYLPNMISGAWTGSMNLTEPQAGSDLAVVRARAERDGDRYRIFGNKIFITWGDHAMTENVIHLVLARLPDAPPGVKGISLFLVPKYLVNTDGSIGERNDAYPVSVEHKLGIHASPTCVMAFGGELSFAAIAVVYLTGSVVGQAAPTPGGLGAVEAAMAAGLTLAGLDSGLAFSAVLLYRVITFWLPTIPGYFAFNWLQRNNYL